MRNLYGPSLVEGKATATVVFKERTTGQEIRTEPDPATIRFRIMLPEGEYTVRSEDESLHRSFLPGASYYLDLRPGKPLDFGVTASTSDKGARATSTTADKGRAASPDKKRITIRVTARGTGAHHFSIRTDNILLSGARKELVLQPGRTGAVEWQATILSKDTPWVVVVIPDDDLSQRQELTETSPKK
jgi:hypothetical protein